MTPHEFLNSAESPPPLQVAAALGMGSDAAVRQWKADPKRKPAPEFVPALERFSGNRVRRWDCYPDTWHRIWPELIGTEGAPPVPESAYGLPNPALPQA